MKFHKVAALVLSVCLAVPAAGCAIDERTGKALADALAAGAVRDYASAQADTMAQTSLLLHQQAAPASGSQADLGGAQSSWLKARAAYDRGAAVFIVMAPQLCFRLDGPADDALAQTGLRPLERALFAMPVASAASLDALTAVLQSDAVALHGAVLDETRPLVAAQLIGSMSAIAAEMATKFDGSLSPYAGASLLSVQHNLIGLQSLYSILSPLVQGADAVLDQQIAGLLKELLTEVQGIYTVDAIADKSHLLRECADLAAALKKIGAVLGLAVTTIDLS